MPPIARPLAPSASTDLRGATLPGDRATTGGVVAGQPRVGITRHHGGGGVAIAIEVARLQPNLMWIYSLSQSGHESQAIRRLDFK